MLEWGLSKAPILSVSHITAFLHFGTLASSSAPRLGVILNSKTTHEKHRKVKMGHPTGYDKDTCIVRELKQEGRAWPCSALAGYERDRWSRFLSLWITESAVSSDLGVTNQLEPVGKFANAEPTREDQLYPHLASDVVWVPSLPRRRGAWDLDQLWKMEESIIFLHSEGVRLSVGLYLPVI